MCLTWLSSWSRPLPVEAQHRNAPAVDDRRIDLAVASSRSGSSRRGRRSRPSRRRSGGSRPSASCRSRRLRPGRRRRRCRDSDGCRPACRSRACAGRRRARCGSRAGSRASCCRATTACRGAMPPAPSSLCGTPFIIFGMKPRDAGAGGVGEVLADHAARVGEALREARRLRVEQQPRRLARARREHDDPRRARGSRGRSSCRCR